jgi:hypothetical protein
MVLQMSILRTIDFENHRGKRVGQRWIVSAWEDRFSELDFSKIHGHCIVPQRNSEYTELPIGSYQNEAAHEKTHRHRQP